MPCLSHGIFSISLSACRKLVKMLSTQNVTDINGTSKTTEFWCWIGLEAFIYLSFVNSLNWLSHD